jgi:peptidoglycan/xylan/chitin deacetylase (PgdA/CDA1 family)
MRKLLIVALLFVSQLGISDTYHRCRLPGLITFTFDDGVSKNTEDLLKILKDLDINASFFIVGETTTSTKKQMLLKAIVNDQHTLANHTYTHYNLNNLPLDKIIQEIQRTQDILDTAHLESYKRYLRPPFGKINNRVFGILEQMKIDTVLWNLDFRDWDLKRSKNTMWSDYYKRIVSSNPAKQSFIVLQHDWRIESVELLPTMVMLAKMQGYRVVSLEQCLGEKS